MTLSVVIPTLNAAALLPGTFCALGMMIEGEAGARLHLSPPGRGRRAAPGEGAFPYPEMSSPPHPLGFASRPLPAGERWAAADVPPEMLRPLCDVEPDEIVVSDGGSADGTVAFARTAGAVVVEGPRGRGGQLSRGADAARGEWLLFLHADTRPEPGWSRAVQDFMNRGEGRAAAFRFALDDSSAAARALEKLVALRIALLALPYGDQGLLLSRELYDALGGFRDVPLMEDVDLIRRIGRRQLEVLPVRAVTSAARYRAEGYARRVARNALCLSLYGLGVSPERIARFYG